MAKKSSPLSVDELIESQKSLLTASNLSEDQRKRAEDQIAKLEELKKSVDDSQKTQTAVLDQNKVITRPKGDSKNVTLGDVRNELKELRKDFKANPNRRPLPKSNEVIDVDAKEVSGKSRTKQNAERVEKLTNIGATLGEKAELYQKGAGKEVAVSKNTETFERFVAETQKKDELLKDASDEQVKLFERLEDTLIKLRDSDDKNSEELRKELAKIAGELETTEDTAAKKSVGGVLENARNRARSGGRGDAGTLGDAWRALSGKQTVLKEGYEFDPRLKNGGVRRTAENEFGKAGQMPATTKGEVFSMGRVAGAAKIAGNFFRGKVEEYNAKNASNAGSNFLDRTFGGNRLEEDRAKLGARAEALIGKRGESPRAQVIPTASAGGRGGAGAINITATAVNVRGPIKLSGTGGPGYAAGNAGALTSKDWPPKSNIPVPVTSTVVMAKAEAKEEGPGLGSTLMDLGGDLLSRGKGLGGRVASAGTGILNAGKNLLGKVPGGMLKGGIAGLAGLGLSYGGDKLKEAGYEKTGAAADIAGQAASWGGTGAMLGSVIPGIGTAVGAGVGAVAGGAYGLYKNWGSLFGGKKSENNQATVTPKSGAALPTTASASSTSIADEPVIPGQPLSDKQMAVIGMSKSSGNSYSPEIEKQYQQQKESKVSSVVPSTPNNTTNKNATIENLSKSNAMAKEANNAKPVIINNTQPAPAAPAPAPSVMMPRGQVRSSESAMDRYSNRNSHFY